MAPSLPKSEERWRGARSLLQLGHDACGDILGWLARDTLVGCGCLAGCGVNSPGMPAAALEGSVSLQRPL